MVVHSLMMEEKKEAVMVESSQNVRGSGSLGLPDGEVETGNKHGVVVNLLL